MPKARKLKKDPASLADKALLDELRRRVAEVSSDFFDDQDDVRDSTREGGKAQTEPQTEVVAALEYAKSILPEFQTDNFRIEAIREISSHYARFDATNARSLLDRATELCCRLSDVDTDDCDHQRGELVNAFVQTLGDHETALALARQLSPSSRTVRVLVNNHSRVDSDGGRREDQRFLELAVETVDKIEDPSEKAEAAIKIAYHLVEHVESTAPPFARPGKGAQWAETAAEFIPHIGNRPSRESRLRELAAWYALVDNRERAESLIDRIKDKNKRLIFYRDGASGFIHHDQLDRACTYLDNIERILAEFDENKPAQHREQQKWLAVLRDCYSKAGQVERALQICDRLADPKVKLSNLWYTIEDASSMSRFEIMGKNTAAYVLEMLISAIEPKERRLLFVDRLADPNLLKAIEKYVQ